MPPYKPRVVDCMDAGGRATQDAVAEELVQCGALVKMLQ